MSSTALKTPADATPAFATAANKTLQTVPAFTGKSDDVMAHWFFSRELHRAGHLESALTYILKAKDLLGEADPNLKAKMTAKHFQILVGLNKKNSAGGYDKAMIEIYKNLETLEESAYVRKLGRYVTALKPLRVDADSSASMTLSSG